MYKIAGQHSFSYSPSFLFRYLERLVRSLVYLREQRLYFRFGHAVHETPEGSSPYHGNQSTSAHTFRRSVLRHTMSKICCRVITMQDFVAVLRVGKPWNLSCNSSISRFTPRVIASLITIYSQYILTLNSRVNQGRSASK